MNYIKQLRSFVGKEKVFYLDQLPEYLFPDHQNFFDDLFSNKEQPIIE